MNSRKYLGISDGIMWQSMNQIHHTKLLNRIAFFVGCLATQMLYAETTLEVETGPGYGLAGHANSMRYELQIEHEFKEGWSIDGLYRTAKPSDSSRWDHKHELGITREFGVTYLRLAGGHMADDGRSYNFYNIQPGFKIPISSQWDLRLAYRFIHSLPNQSVSGSSQTYRTALEYKWSKDLKIKIKWDHERREMNEFALGIAYSLD